MRKGEKEGEKKMSIFVIGCGHAGVGRIADLLEKQESFEPHGLSVEQMECMTLSDVSKQHRYRDIEFGTDLTIEIERDFSEEGGGAL